MSQKYFYKIGDIIETKTGTTTIDDSYLKRQKNGRNRTCHVCHCQENHIYEKYASSMTTACPICCGRIIVKGINDISTTNPWMFSLLTDKEFGYTHAQHSNKKTNWNCPDCGSLIKNVPPNQVARQGLPCPNCGDGVSYGEKYIANLLSNCNIEYIKEYDKTYADWCDNYRYDFYLPKYDWIIEVHGIQHYEDAWCSKEKTQENDYQKQILAEQHVSNYIIIDASKSDKWKLKRSILYSDLFHIICNRYTPWEKIHRDSVRSNVSKAAELYNKDAHHEDIAAILDVSKDTVRSYLKTANDIGLCNYTPEKAKIDSYEKLKLYNTQNRSKPIICNENGFAFANSKKCDELSLKLLGKHLSSSNIKKVLSGERHHTGNYSFSYISRSEFNRIKRESPEKAFGDFFLNETKT